MGLLPVTRTLVLLPILLALKWAGQVTRGIDSLFTPHTAYTLPAMHTWGVCTQHAFHVRASSQNLIIVVFCVFYNVNEGRWRYCCKFKMSKKWNLLVAERRSGKASRCVLSLQNAQSHDESWRQWQWDQDCCLQYRWNFRSASKKCWMCASLAVCFTCFCRT